VILIRVTSEGPCSLSYLAFALQVCSALLSCIVHVVPCSESGLQISGNIETLKAVQLSRLVGHEICQQTIDKYATQVWYAESRGPSSSKWMPQDQVGPTEFTVGKLVWIFSIRALFVNCSSARTRVVSNLCEFPSRKIKTRILPVEIAPNLSGLC
jgi:hypothetical protein